MPTASDINYSLLPEHMREGAQRYIEQGIGPGDFLHLIFCNDFVHAACHADAINLASLVDYTRFLYMEAPLPCWGSKAKVLAWARQGGLIGFKQQEDPSHE